MLSKENRDLILVPCDFTEEFKTALFHASKVAKAGDDEVRLLHILNRESRAQLKKEGRDESWVNRELAAICADNQSSTGVNTSFHVEEGSIFNTIGEYATSQGADLVVMGTHGVRGIQHVVGAYALKVVTSCPVPVIIVQRRKADMDGYAHIVISIDESKFGKNKLIYAAAIARYFNATLHVYADQSSDEYLGKALQRNVQQAVKTFEGNKISVKVIEHDGKKGSLAKGMIRYAESIGADLMVISSQPDMVNISNLLLGNHEEELINNEAEIPVMCVNPNQDISHLPVELFS